MLDYDFQPLEYSTPPFICTFADNPLELFTFVPTTVYPLTPEQLKSVLAKRMCNTVPVYETK